LAALLGNLDQAVETKAAHLLYFVIKNHPFSDGNKRSVGRRPEGNHDSPDHEHAGPAPLMNEAETRAEHIDGRMCWGNASQVTEGMLPGRQRASLH